MAIVYHDCVKQKITSLDIADLTLDNVNTISGFRTFDSVLTSGDQVYYLLEDAINTLWEIGIGTFSSPDILVRTSILQSNNNGSKIDIVSSSDTTVSINIPATTLQTMYDTTQHYLTRGSLVGEYTVTGSATNSVAFSGLDSSFDIGYTVICKVIAVGGSTEALAATINDMSTSSFYKGKHIYRNAAATGANVNTDLFWISKISTTASGICYAKHDFTLVGSYVHGLGDGTDYSLNENILIGNVCTVPISNINKLEFKINSGANSIGVGSKFELYRWLV